MRGRDVHLQGFDEPGEPRGLPLRQVEDESRQGGGVDDGVLERALQPPTDEPGVEGVVAVLDEDRSLGETQKCAPRVLELGRPDEHRPVDVVALARVGVDRRAAVDERVEEGKRGLETKALGADLEDEEGGVAGRLDVEGDELRLVERCLRTDLRGVDGDLVPRHELRCSPRLEEHALGCHERAIASARRAHAISSPVRARSRSTATP